MKISKNTIITAIVLVVCFFVLFNFLFSTKNLFRHNIINPIPQSVVNIKSYKDKSAMHGAIIFKFSANENDTKEIIRINSLSKYEEIPDEISYIITNRFNDIGWWKSSDELEKMKIYGKLTENEYDWNALFIFIDDSNTKYIIKI